VLVPLVPSSGSSYPREKHCAACTTHVIAFSTRHTFPQPASQPAQRSNLLRPARRFIVIACRHDSAVHATDQASQAFANFPLFARFGLQVAEIFFLYSTDTTRSKGLNRFCGAHALSSPDAAGATRGHDITALRVCVPRVTGGGGEEIADLYRVRRRVASLAPSSCHSLALLNSQVLHGARLVRCCSSPRATSEGKHHAGDSPQPHHNAAFTPKRSHGFLQPPRCTCYCCRHDNCRRRPPREEGRHVWPQRAQDDNPRCPLAQHQAHVWPVDQGDMARHHHHGHHGRHWSGCLHGRPRPESQLSRHLPGRRDCVPRVCLPAPQW
jgi:hypothetical protein